jgi:Flp pilus assembly protein CpaB
LIGVAFFVISRGGLFPGAAGPTAVPAAPMVDIVVVLQPINRDDQIKEDALTTMQFPQASLTSKMITDKQLLLGKYAVYPLSQGMPVTTDMVSDRPGLNQPGSEAAKVVSPGLVAISIPITRLSAVAYGIKDGDRVNVIATTMFVDVDANFQSRLPNLTANVTGPGFTPDTLPTLSATVLSGGPGAEQGRAELDPTLNQALYLVPSEPQRPRLVSQMILQDIQVLHMGDFLLPEEEAQAAQAQAQPVEGQPTPTPPVIKQPELITLIVTPQDAVALTYLMYSGSKFTLTLRAPDDTSRVETEATTLQYLLSQYAIPVPAKLPYVMNNNSIPLVQKVEEPGTTAAPVAP